VVLKSEIEKGACRDDNWIVKQSAERYQLCCSEEGTDRIHTVGGFSDKDRVNLRHLHNLGKRACHKLVTYSQKSESKVVSDQRLVKMHGSKFDKLFLADVVEQT
jgi:hypothetical protein